MKDIFSKDYTPLDKVHVSTFYKSIDLIEPLPLPTTRKFQKSVQ